LKTNYSQHFIGNIKSRKYGNAKLADSKIKQDLHALLYNYGVWVFQEFNRSGNARGRCRDRL